MKKDHCGIIDTVKEEDEEKLGRKRELISICVKKLIVKELGRGQVHPR